MQLPDETDDSPPEDAEWHALYFRAFDALRFDRQFGAFGGETPISYMAISRYADDHGIHGEDRAMFRTLMQALDNEWLAHARNKEKAKQ